MLRKVLKSINLQLIAFVIAQVPVLVVNNARTLERARLVLHRPRVLALDCEGVNLGRKGQITLVQVATQEHCCLFDVKHKGRSSDLVIFLRSLLQDENIIKIIHDVKADSDALYHLLGISVTAIHDTQAYQMVIRPTGDSRGLNLNSTLQQFGCPINEVRDTNVYKANPAFWATRPLTEEMVLWAAGDVAALHMLRQQQLQLATYDQLLLAAAASEANISEMRDAIAESVFIMTSKKGLFIGPQGSNLRSFMARHSVHVCSTHTVTDGNCEFVVYAKTPTAMNAARNGMRRFQRKVAAAAAAAAQPKKKQSPKKKKSQSESKKTET
jgi:3'-5' exonuclease